MRCEPACGRVYGISFDGIAASGITTEFLKLAGCFRARGYEVFLDLGYDIKPDKGSLFRPYGPEAAGLPPWVRLDRLPGLEAVDGYADAFVQASHTGAATGLSLSSLRSAHTAAAIAALLVERWRALDVTMVVVENGTLPENPAFTRALYQAVETYGRELGIGKFVLWRDHDVMWFCEPEKYGAPPWNYAPRPYPSPFIHHAAITAPAARTLSEWAGGTPVDVIPNCFEFRRPPRRAGVREALGIPVEAFVIARCTRVIPQKRIDREIVLLRLLGTMAAAHGFRRPLHLVITGPTTEHPIETAYLRRLAASLGVESQVHFADGLLPCGADGGISVSDLLAEADLSSFLTSYRYEGFGNPPAEACAHGVPFVSTRYELYDAVYGPAELRALLLPIAAADDGAPDDAWAATLLDRIADPARLAADAAHNFDAARRHFSLDHLERRLCALFPGHLAAGYAVRTQPLALSMGEQ